MEGEQFINPDLSMGTKILRGAHKSYLLVSKIPLFGWINKLQGVCLFLGYKVFCVGICKNIKNIIISKTPEPFSPQDWQQNVSVAIVCHTKSWQMCCLLLVC